MCFFSYVNVYATGRKFFGTLNTKRFHAALCYDFRHLTTQWVIAKTR